MKSTFDQIKINEAMAIDLDSPELIELHQIEQIQTTEILERLKAGIVTNPIPLLFQLPYGTKIVRNNGISAVFTCNKGKQQGLLVVASINIYEDKIWYHVSFSYKDKFPSYSDSEALP